MMTLVMLMMMMEAEGRPPAEAQYLGDLAAGARPRPVPQGVRRHRGVYYVQSPELVQKLLGVDRYRQRWPVARISES